MGKYLNKPALTPGQEAEIFPILDKALSLPFGKAILYPCSKSRASYLSRTLNGERYRNAIESISAYPDTPLYGKGLYYNLVIEHHPKGLLVANVENPPPTLTWYIIECAASRKPVNVSHYYKSATIIGRLNKLRERHQEIRPIYLDRASGTLHYAIPGEEDMIVVDIDVKDKVPQPTREQRAKLRQ